MDIAGMAAKADTVVKEIAKIEPAVAGAIGIFVPGAGPFVALAQPFISTFLTYGDRALADIATGNGGDVGAAFLELLNHMMKGGPNSPTLSSGTSTTPIVTATNAALASVTTQAVDFQAVRG